MLAGDRGGGRIGGFHVDCECKSAGAHGVMLVIVRSPDTLLPRHPVIKGGLTWVLLRGNETYGTVWRVSFFRRRRYVELVNGWCERMHFVPYTYCRWRRGRPVCDGAEGVGSE